MNADLINGLFEVFGGAFIFLSIRRLHREKIVRGVSLVHVMFFTLWGAWNLYYYPSLDQWFSFVGGVAVSIANVTWFGQIIYYSIAEKMRKRRERREFMRTNSIDSPERDEK